ncbi:DEAD/DEAH box helicase [Gluconacetobacter takamatsuzukensis]|uniref:Helicase n=1 Tax=Gluconacetobacter takamatsuzukensis TaxID=1286190 RepID=A0A7W4KE48_9PROT|nr:AAA domain-containing protein [Gluconacetobacter takamatsuzukensis]MBB2205263.1 helicase [Gluconacetobacter takamatsuzukensis]
MDSLHDCPVTLDIGRVLHFWHQVEFFIPFDLQQQVLEARDADWSVRSWPLHDLPEGPGMLWTVQVPEDRRLTGFDIYLGVFDKSVLTEIVRDALSGIAEYDQEERTDLEGLTCMARIKAGPSGEASLGEVSVSTTPWALGRVQANGLAGLDFAAFQDSIEILKQELLQFRTGGTVPPESPASGKPALTGDDLKALLVLFQRWAGYVPQTRQARHPVLVIRANTVESRRQNPTTLVPREPIPAEEDEPEDAAAEPEIDILNSFFATDIARAIRSLKQQETCTALQAYLSPVPKERRLNLYSAEGRAHIRATLAPGRLPAGHWPDEPAHSMSLMQQFAINSLLDRLDLGGIFSVNGPPGTGKTTLLRDVFAELITRRARVLAGLSTPQDAFTGRHRVEFRDRSSASVSTLRDDLAGFEMVVASSNNAAVENLSRDLPKTKALGKNAWRDRHGGAGIGYLQTVAHNIAAEAGKRGYRDLSGEDGRGDDIPWGLIAATLGRKANRSRFATGLGQDGSSKDPRPKGFDPTRHQSLWNWRKRTDLPTFAAARTAFMTADQAVTRRIDAMQRFAALEVRLRGQTLETFSIHQDAAHRQAQATVASAQAELDRLTRAITLHTSQLAILDEQERTIAADRPARWTRWLHAERERRCKTELEPVRDQKKSELAALYQAQGSQPTAEAALVSARLDLADRATALADRLAEWQALQAEWSALSASFPQIRFPDSDAALDDPRWQIDGLWRDDTLNRLRSQLFAAALGLHEAWLAEVLQQNGGFGGNVVAVSKLLSGTRLSDSKDALAIWQSLFMIVPVVSSTFASIATQFRELGPESIGWLFIDEAGQAVPQAAVGALWRAKRAVVVGDPMQIEPVFTVPVGLIEALAGAAGLTGGARVGPHQISVQTLADGANDLGAWVPDGEETQWIGSPLRVHRRCVDPMFTIANAIAYQDKMIFFDPDNPQSRLPPPDTLDLGPSAWVGLGGIACDRQVVPDQVTLACQAVQLLYRRTGKLPDLYVISPFRRIKRALIERIADLKQWPQDCHPKIGDLKDWCRTRIGTVHTFQGKEESVVLMVLGCDGKSAGAAQWTASKPNLLNVALTRARHRFFLIGDEALWAGRPNFSAASGQLPRITPAVFLERARGDAPAP